MTTCGQAAPGGLRRRLSRWTMVLAKRSAYGRDAQRNQRVWELGFGRRRAKRR